jgi:DNA replicative helicase MCM subunit Mcm2 (Cdc46/Mcm family)
MSIDMYRFSARLRSLQEQKRNLEREYVSKLSSIDEQIKKEEEVLTRVNEALSPYICSSCDGSGRRYFLDAAGSRDYETCKRCGGSGIEPAG